MENRAVLRRPPNRLAPGRQVRVEWRDTGPVLVQPGGAVQLNESAAAILVLCDGTRTSEDVIEQFLASAPKTLLASDVRDFLDAARQRGWIVEL